MGRFQTCMKHALKGKHIKGKTRWRAAFKAAAKRCARGAKYTKAGLVRHKRRKGAKRARRVGRRVRRVARKSARRMKRVGTIVCRLK